MTFAGSPGVEGVTEVGGEAVRIRAGSKAIDAA
jgi:hypothetical protein